MKSYARITTTDGDQYEIKSSDPDVLKSVAANLMDQIGPFKLESITMKMKKRGWTCCNECNMQHRFYFTARIHRKWIALKNRFKSRKQVRLN